MRPEGHKDDQRAGALSYEERLRELVSLSLEKRKLWGNLIAAFQYLKGAYKKAGEGLFTRTCRNRARGNGFKLKEGRFRLEIRKTFFMVRVVGCWKRLPREFVGVPSLEVFKARLHVAFSNMGLVEGVRAHGREVGIQWSLRFLTT